MRTLILILLLWAVGCDESGTTDAPASVPAPAPIAESDPVPTTTIVSNAGTYEITHELVDTEQIPLNDPFTFTVQVMPADDVTLEIDAAMPEHRHGMIRLPVVTPLGDGAFRVDGMLLHMAGRWEVYFDVTREGVTERAECGITLQ